MRVAVVGGGVSGLVAARELLARSSVSVVVYEKEGCLGGHARTVEVDGIPVDVGFMVFNRITYPNMLEMFEEIGIDVEKSDMSFSVSFSEGRGCEWGSNGLSGLFAQKSNLFNPFFLQMIKEIIGFQNDVLVYLKNLDGKGEDADMNETLGQFIQSHKYSQKFWDCYLSPMCASIWSCSPRLVLYFSAASVLSFFRNHHLLQIFGRPQWLTIKGRSRTYVDKFVVDLQARGCEIRTCCAVTNVSKSDEGVCVLDENGEIELFDRCIIAAHAPDALRMLGRDATADELSILGSFHYNYSNIYLHRDERLMPKRFAAWSAWNFLGCQDGHACITYWINVLQNLGDTGSPILVTVNPSKPPEQVIMTWYTSHPIPSPSAVLASKKLNIIQGKRGIWFCGAYQGYGFHEDGLKSGLNAARNLLGIRLEPRCNVMYVCPSWLEWTAQRVVKSFLEGFLQIGQLQLLEAGGLTLNFVGNKEGCNLKCSLHIQRPSFYWKVASRADLGLADAYIDGDFTCVDSQNGLLNFFMILAANRDIQSGALAIHKRRGWWSPILVTSVVASAVYYFRHLLRRNCLTNARRNISAHYDLSNEFFTLFLDETMTYSCAIFKEPGEPLRNAQLRKIHHIINKAKVNKHHEVLEIGFGWGSLALEMVKYTGCKYTGISLSEEQLKFAQQRVKEAGLQDKIRLELCDYRTIPGHKKFDRIISCEMLEAVGHEYLKEFFSICDRLLAKDGIVVVQVISIPEARYEEYRASSDFIKEYIFPGGCLPSLNTLTTAMASGSLFCIENIENIGIHYFQTLIEWRERFRARHSEIRCLGFNEKFLRMWEYYFMYCAAGFKSCTLGVLQIVFSRPGNVVAFGSPYENALLDELKD